MNDISGRFTHLLKLLGLSQNQFGKEIGMDSARVSNVARGRNEPSSDFLVRIIAGYPQVNIYWLLTGEGEPIKATDWLHLSPNSRHLTQKNVTQWPESSQIVVPVVANAGNAVSADFEQYEGEAAMVPGVPVGAVIIKVAGESMHPTLYDGDYVVCIKKEGLKECVWKDIHVVITKESMCYVKRLTRNLRGIELSSDNHAHPSINITESEIAQVWHCIARIGSLVSVQSPGDLQARISHIEEYLGTIFSDFKQR